MTHSGLLWNQDSGAFTKSHFSIVRLFMCGCQGPCTCQLTSAERWSRLSFSACLPGRTAVSLLGPQQTCSSWHIIPSWLIVPVSFYQPAISTSSKFTSLTTSLRLNFVTAFPPSLYPPLSASLPSPSLLGRSISVSPLPLLPLRYASILIFVISAFSHPPYLPVIGGLLQPSPGNMSLDCDETTPV